MSITSVETETVYVVVDVIYYVIPIFLYYIHVWIIINYSIEIFVNSKTIVLLEFFLLSIFMAVIKACDYRCI